MILKAYVTTQDLPVEFSGVAVDSDTSERGLLKFEIGDTVYSVHNVLYWTTDHEVSDEVGLNRLLDTLQTDPWSATD